MFLLKKVISFWLMPLPLGLALLVIGLGLLLFSRRRNAGRRILTVGVAWLLVLSNRAVSQRLLQPLESRYPPVPVLQADRPLPPELAACRFVVVLGSGQSGPEDWAATTRLSPSGLARIVEAVRLIRLMPGIPLIVSGPGDPGRLPHAAVLAQAAESLGVDRSRITLITTARDTEDETVEIRRLAGTARVALVTSAWHMPRAVALCRKAGVSCLPCPTEFLARPGDDTGWEGLGWDSDALGRSTRAVHEWLGLLWTWLRVHV